ncbi:MAG: hypothetical protein JSR21_20550, partial [Proteobacteria bacterium]|nr:hypothetical protein [Pseudomonadota bacterium]
MTSARKAAFRTAAALGLLAAAGAAQAAPEGYLAGIKHFKTLTSTVPDSGDQNPYAIV